MYQIENYVEFGSQKCVVIGNSFKDKVYHLKNMVEIQSLDNFTDVGIKSIDDLKNIRITKDILEKFEFYSINHVSVTFKKYTTDNKGDVMYLRLLNVGANPSWILDYNTNDSYFKKEIKYVHELQNFWQQFTGEYLLFNRP